MRVASANPAGKNHADEAADGTGGDGLRDRGIAGFFGSGVCRARSTAGRGRDER